MKKTSRTIKLSAPVKMQKQEKGTLPLVVQGYRSQIPDYLRAYKLGVGLLNNFGSKSLTFKKISPQI